VPSATTSSSSGSDAWSVFPFFFLFDIDDFFFFEDPPKDFLPSAITAEIQNGQIMQQLPNSSEIYVPWTFLA